MTLFGFGLCFLLSGMEAIKTKKSDSNIPLLIIGLVFGSILLRLWLYSKRLIVAVPFAHFGFFASVTAIGPATHYLAAQITELNKPKLLFPLIPSVILLFFDMVYIATGNIPNHLENSLYKTRFDFFNFLMLFVFLHITGYFFYIIYLFRNVSKEVSIDHKPFIWFILFSATIGASFVAFGYFLLNQIFFSIGCCLLTILVICFYLFPVRYPRFFYTLRTVIQEKKYEAQILRNVDVNSVKKKLESLMNEERYYKEEDLNLPDLALELMITTHQLSRILNEEYGKNFREFINTYRIAEAKELLLNESSKNVLSIAFEVGFSSKAAFNAQFLKIVGTTPTEFKNKGRK